MHNGTICEWIEINKGTTKGSVSGPYIFCIFLNDREIEVLDGVSLSKYTDDSNLLAIVNDVGGRIWHYHNFWTGQMTMK